MRIASPKRRDALPVSRLALPVVVAAMLLSIDAPASADVGATIINRCTHGQSLGGFSQRAYRQALQELPTEVEEYSDCANLIRRAELAAAGKGTGGESGAAVTPIPVTPAERNSLNRASKLGSAPVRVGGEIVRPGVIHAGIASALNSLPSPLLAILAFLLACALALAGRAVRNGVRAHRSR
jgi:hypothetical protein